MRLTQRKAPRLTTMVSEYGGEAVRLVGSDSNVQDSA